MNILLIVLRLIHIMAAVSWFGMALVTFVYIIPADKLAGEGGLRFMKAFYTGTPIARVFPIVSVVTVVAGILLYITGSNGNFSPPPSLGQIVLGIGAIAGLLAAGHGGMAAGKYTGLYAASLTKNLPESGSPSKEGLAEIEAAREKYILHVRISFILALIALIFMASARYF